MNTKYYADASYYITSYRGTLDLEYDEIEALLNKAYDNISIETLGRSYHLEEYGEEVANRVKRAACYEAEAIAMFDSNYTAMDVIGGYNIGDVGVSFKDNKGISTGGVISKRARGLLEQTPLMNRWI